MKISSAQRRTLELIAQGNVVYSPYGHYYHRRDARGGVRIDTMTVLLREGLAQRPAAKMGVYTPITVKITDAGQAALS